MEENKQKNKQTHKLTTQLLSDLFLTWPISSLQKWPHHKRSYMSDAPSSTNTKRIHLKLFNK